MHLRHALFPTVKSISKKCWCFFCTILNRCGIRLNWHPILAEFNQLNASKNQQVEQNVESNSLKKRLFFSEFCSVPWPCSLKGGFIFIYAWMKAGPASLFSRSAHM